MHNTEMNFKAFYFSPYFWWKSFERGVYLTDAITSELIPNFEFKKWLKEDVVEHDSLLINQVTSFGINKEYGEAIKNDYFFEVIATNTYGQKVKAKSVDELFDKYEINEEIPLSYSFKIEDLTQFISMYFQQWLIFDTYYYWVRWQLYFDFLVSKLDNQLKGLYIYMWNVILNQVEIQNSLFKDIAQYKKFRDKLDDIKQESDFIEKTISELRQTKK